MPRVAVNIQPFVKDLLAHLRLVTGSGKRTAPFFGTTRVETESKLAHEISDCLWFEYRGIDAGLEHARIPGIERFTNRFVGDASGVEFRDVEMVAQEISRTGPIRRAGSHSQTHQTTSIVNK